jgi:16S rRNA (cytidine1402-2'-O)-methyltransferase
MVNDFPEERRVESQGQPTSGLLYLVATPIGNLGDLGYRAVEILKSVDVIVCEDTRHSRPLLDHYGIDRPLAALHEHNEDRISAGLVERMRSGEQVALISDAGSPLISDPGFPLVRQAREAGVRVSPIPGPCALIAALSVSGLASHRFAFEGFPPRKRQARRSWMESLRDEARTLIFYESSHRIEETIQDVAAMFPASRRLVIARELTKRFETVVSTTVGAAVSLLTGHPEMRLGEFVVLIEGVEEKAGAEQLTPAQLHTLRVLLEENSVKKAVELTTKISGARRELVYREALRWSETKSDSD